MTLSLSFPFQSVVPINYDMSLLGLFLYESDEFCSIISSHRPGSSWKANSRVGRKAFSKGSQGYTRLVSPSGQSGIYTTRIPFEIVDQRCGYVGFTGIYPPRRSHKGREGVRSWQMIGRRLPRPIFGKGWPGETSEGLGN